MKLDNKNFLKDNNAYYSKKSIMIITSIICFVLISVFGVFIFFDMKNVDKVPVSELTLSKNDLPYSSGSKTITEFDVSDNLTNVIAKVNTEGKVLNLRKGHGKVGG